MVEVCHLSVSLFVETYDFLYEFRIISFQTVTVLLQIQDCPTLRLHLVYIKIVDTGDFIACLSTLYMFSFLEITLFRCFFCGAQFMLDAELVVASLILPELLQRLTL